jgi:hypothetical protein
VPMQLLRDEAAGEASRTKDRHELFVLRHNQGA